MKNMEIRDEISEMNDVLEVNTMLDGWQIVFNFQNGYGASVINHSGSYGLELAVIKFWDETPYECEWNICYDTSITNDVIGHLTIEELRLVVNKIKLLKRI